MRVHPGRLTGFIGALVFAAVFAGGLSGAAARAEVAVVYSARTSSGSLDDASLKALARERGSVEVWARTENGTLKRDMARWGDPAVANPLFMTGQAGQMDEWIAKGAKTDLQKDGSSLVTVPLAKGLDMVYTRPKSDAGPTFEVRIVQDGEVLLTEQWWEETTAEGVKRPRYIRIDDGVRVMVQVFDYTDAPPPVLPPATLVKEGYEAIPEGMKPVQIPLAAPDKADETQTQEIQFLVPQQGLDTLGFDSGWFPSGGTGDPGGFVIQLRVKAAAGYNYDANVSGMVSLAEGNMLGLGAAQGTWGFYFGAEFSLKAAADLSWVPLIGQYLDPFEIDIPYVPEFNMVASDRDDFNTWLLDSVSEVRDEAGRTNITSLDIIALAITQGVLPELPSWLPVKPSIVVGLDIAAVAHGTLACDNIAVSDGTVFTTEGQALPISVPQTGYTALASYNENASLDLGARLYPYFTASIKVISWSWGYTYPDASDPNNFLNQIEWLPIKHRTFPFSDAEINFTGLPSTGEPTDWFTQHFNLSTNDLDYLRLRFTPNLSNNFYVACLEEGVTAYRTPVAGSTEITLPDDGFSLVTLSEGKQVSLYGKKYGSFFVGSNGYITFDQGDSASDVSLDNHFSQPRISGLYCDLKPNAGGKVYFKQLPNRAVVTWDNVRVTNVITEQTASIQVEMFFDGRITITWLKIDEYFGLAGLSRGGGKPANFANSRLSKYGGCLSGIADEGGVRVNFAPPEVLPLNPRWRVDNGAWMPSGTYTSAPLGQHTVSFNYIPNLWQAPVPISVNLTQPDVFVNLTPEWTRQRGVVRVYTQPAEGTWTVTDADGAQHDGAGNAELAGIPTGPCTITWHNLPTWSLPEPPTQEYYLYPNASVVFSGSYAPIIGEGRANLTLVLGPELALAQGGQWRVNGGPWLNSGDTVEIPDGNNTISVKDLSGWTKPANQTLFFNRNTSTTLTKAYVRQTGTVIIDTDPNNAPWTVADMDGGTRTGNGDAVLSGVPAGAVTVTWGALPSYTEPVPNPATQTLMAGATLRLTGAYTPTIGEGQGILRVTLHPDAAVAAGAQWRLIGGEWRSSGGMEAVADGERTVKFLDMEGWVTPADLTVNVVRDIINDASADYTRLTGSVVLDVTPDNAPWTITDADGNSQTGTGDMTFPTVPTGAFTVQWGELEGYSSPDPNPASFTVAQGETLSVQGVFIQAVVTAAFEAFPLSGAAPLMVTFTDHSTSTTKALQEWRWYFGDGKTSTERHPRHEYRNPGTYTVTLSVSTAEKMGTESKKHLITVGEGLPAAGLPALAVMAALSALAGARLLRRRR